METEEPTGAGREGRPGQCDRLQVEVRRLKTRSGRHRTLPTLLHVGSLGGARLVVPLAGLDEIAGGRDRGLATDLVTRALDRMDRPSDQQVWLTRSGPLEASDRDWLWHGATVAARARHGVAAGSFYLLTRYGWLELPSGRRRTWRRMRATWRAPYDDDRADPVAPDPIEGWPIAF